MRGPDVRRSANRSLINFSCTNESTVNTFRYGLRDEKIRRRLPARQRWMPEFLQTHERLEGANKNWLDITSKNALLQHRRSIFAHDFVNTSITLFFELFFLSIVQFVVLIIFMAVPSTIVFFKLFIFLFIILSIILFFFLFIFFCQLVYYRL